MPPKKGKGKKATLTKVGVDEVRLTLLRTQEAEAEEFQRSENAQRQRAELEERLVFLRDEQLRVLREKDRRIDDLVLQLSRATAAMQEDRLGYESQLQQLSTLRDALMNEESLRKVEMEELQAILRRERASSAAQVQQLREAAEAERSIGHAERQQLRTQASSASALAEDYKQQLQHVSEVKDVETHSKDVKQRELERALEKALAMNKALQEAVEGRDAEDRKNVTLLQLLNAQLDADKRRYDVVLQEEQAHTRRAQEEVARLEAKCITLHGELETTKREAWEAKQATEAELHEYKQLTEQVKADAEFLHREIDTMRSEHREAMDQAEKTAEELRRELLRCQVDLEASERKGAELEAMLLRKEREHFDKATFLNAQVSNGRTAIAELQAKLRQQQAVHEEELARHNASIQKAVAALEENNRVEKERIKERYIRDQSMMAETEKLKGSVADLRARLIAREEAHDQLRADKDHEVDRLRQILDAHFIPNRQDVEASRESARVDELLVAKEELRALEKEMLLKEAAAKETETWLRARIAEQVDIIDALQLDLKRNTLGSNENVRVLQDEVSRLRKTLEIHSIPCS